MVLLYDGSFEGFLSLIFEVYSRKLNPTHIFSANNYQESFFAEKIFISSNAENADRVWKGWQKKLSKNLDQLPFQAFLSAQQGIELSLLHFAQLSFASNILLENNFANQDILEIRKAARKVSHEAMRMIQFIRFQKTKDNIYFSGINPCYDVLPFIINHFRDRFTDQQWLIYDIKRDYGFFYNTTTTEEVILNDKSFNTINGRLPIDILEEGEANYQTLWKDYCKHTTIKERINLKLQKQHMPKRYWRYMTEKQI